MANEIYNTSWWGTALDTARTAGTNPDFFGSQFKLLTSEQDNLVVNGDFEDGENGWTLDSNWSITNGVATSDGLSNGFITTDDTIFTSGTTYKVTITVSGRTAGRVSLPYDGSGATYINTDGEHIQYYTPDNTEKAFIYGRDGFDGSIDNVSVQLVRCDLDQIEAKKCLADWIHTTALKDLNN